MKIIAYQPDYNPKHCEIIQALAAGIPGCQVKTLGDYEPCDIAIIFGGYKYAFAKTLPKKEILDKHAGRGLLCIEEAFVRRGDYYQVGWGGFAGLADFNNENVPSDRWDAMGVPVLPWERNRDGRIIIMGQLARDVQVQDTDHYRWCRTMFHALAAAGEDVWLKPHPKEKDPGAYGVPRILMGSMDECLKGAKSVVTWNSTSAVDAILRGIPAVAMHRSSIAYDVAAHDLFGAISPHYPARYDWLRRLGYSQWTLQEMASGVVWRHLTGDRHENP